MKFPLNEVSRICWPGLGVAGLWLLIVKIVLHPAYWSLPVLIQPIHPIALQRWTSVTIDSVSLSITL